MTVLGIKTFLRYLAIFVLLYPGHVKAESQLKCFLKCSSLFHQCVNTIDDGNWMEFMSCTRSTKSCKNKCLIRPTKSHASSSVVQRTSMVLNSLYVSNIS